jgi:hypothetical protein
MIIAVDAPACANGSTRMNGIGEMRVKECDRLAAMIRGLIAVQLPPACRVLRFCLTTLVPVFQGKGEDCYGY